VQKAIPVLRDMGRASVELYEQLAVLDGLDCGYHRTGLLTLFRNRRSFEDGIKEANLQAANGITVKVLDGAAVRQMEPLVRPEVIGGVYLPGDAHFTPDLFVRGLARRARRNGLTIHPATEVLGFEVSERKVTTVRTTRGDFQPDQVVIAAGAWSARLVRDLRLKLPLQPAKGYSVTVKRPATSPTIPLALGESRVIVTPMLSPSGPVLRFAGTLELAGFDFSIDRRRVNALTRAARTYLVGMDDLETLEIWRGLRPCTPDDLPILGRPPSLDNVILATGHGMLGMSLGPITGKLVSQIVCGEKPDVDLKPLRVERF
jgi:D-amino-acid dehydrogenase